MDIFLCLIRMNHDAIVYLFYTWKKLGRLYGISVVDQLLE